MDKVNKSGNQKAAEIIDLGAKRQEKLAGQIFERWQKFYSKAVYEDLLEALVYEHENGFPLKTSEVLSDRLRHRALVEALDAKAQTEFLKNFLQDIENQDAQNK